MTTKMGTCELALGPSNIKKKLAETARDQIFVNTHVQEHAEVDETGRNVMDKD